MMNDSVAPENRVSSIQDVTVFDVLSFDELRNQGSSGSPGIDYMKGKIVEGLACLCKNGTCVTRFLMAWHPTRVHFRWAALSRVVAKAK